MNTASSTNRLCFALDMMCSTISDWRRFANALGLGGNLIKDLEENVKYNDIHEKINKCIVEKTERSVVADPDWFYWRNILLHIDEGLLVDDIEVKYPCLLQDDRIDISSTVHKAFDEFGIITHEANRKELFEKLATKPKDKIEICIGGGAKKMLAVRKMQDMSNIYESYFQKYNILEQIKIYDFSKKNNECKVLQTMYTWLQKNNDAGFAIKGYDVKQHVERLSESYYNETPYNDSYILTYSEKNNVVFYVDTDPMNVKKSMRDNRLNIRNLRTSNECLDGNSFTFLPITLTDPNAIKEIKCKTCIELQLVVTTETFSDQELFGKWWEQISTEVEDITNEQKVKRDISTDFLKSIIGFMAIAAFDLPSLTNSPEKEIHEAQNLIMLTPEQQKVIYSKNKRKIIKGSFGSGKTVTAQQLIKRVVSNLNALEFVYYVYHEASGAYVEEMNKLIKSFDKQNVIACTFFDLVGENKSLSSLLRYLSQAHEGHAVHIFVEEFNGEALDEQEVTRIKFMLQEDVFKNSHIVLVCQSMESIRYENQFRSRLRYNKYQFKKLLEQADFGIFELSFLLRSSQQINNLVDAALPILSKAVIKYTIPKDMNKESIEAIDQPTTSNSLKNEPSREKNSSPEIYKLELLEKSLKGSEKSNETISETKSVNNVRHSVIAKGDSTCLDTSKLVSKDDFRNISDTDKLLKHLTVNSNQYKLKTKLLSSYNFVGKRNSGHSVKGIKPVMFYPFNQEKKGFLSKISDNIKKIFINKNTSYIQHIFCLSKVLQKMELNKNEEKQIIICMNADSKRMMKDALEVNKTAWTDDLRLLSTTYVHVLLTDYTSVRGCEFLNVIVVYSNDEGHLKQNLIDCISRGVFNIRLIVLNHGDVADKALDSILDEWKSKDLVEIDDENYLTNSTQKDLEKFIETNSDLLLKDDEKEIMDMNVVKVIQQKYNTKYLNNENQTAGTDATPASTAILKQIWNICERAGSSNDVILLFDALEQNNLNIDSIYILDLHIGNLLHYAIFEDSVKSSKLLINMGIDINQISSTGCSPIHNATEKNNIDIVRLLLQQDNIDINITDEDGWSPLHIAADENTIDVVKLLLQHDSIDINTTDKNGWSPLNVAARENNIDVVKLLLQHDNIDINITTNQGCSPLHVTAAKNNIDVVKLLLQHDNIDINITDEDGWSPLHIAADKNTINVVKLLLQHDNIDINIATKDGCSPLYAAVLNNSIDAIRLLLQQDRIDINIATKDGCSPLYAAVVNNSIDAIRLLLQQDRIDINITNRYGRSPLHVAAMYNSIDVLKLLLQQDNIDINITDR